MRNKIVRARMIGVFLNFLLERHWTDSRVRLNMYLVSLYNCYIMSVINNKNDKIK